VTPFVPAPGLVQARLFNRQELINVENRLWFLKEDLTITQSDLDSLAVGVASWYSEEILPNLSQNVAFLGALTEKFDDHIGDLFGETFSRDVGGVTEAPHSANVAVRVNFRWPVTARQRKNCHFVPGIPLNALNGNQVDITWAESLWEGYVDLIDRARLFEPTFSWRWVLASAFDNGSIRAEQHIQPCIGPVHWRQFAVAQRRKRLA
jgi:hypothetical protein